MNVALGALTLGGLFWLAERLGADAFIAALGALLLGFSHGFWEGTLRPDPYALAAAGSAASLLILIGHVPGDARRRYPRAGAAVGLTMLFHTSGLSLLPVAGLALWLEGDGARERARALAAFAAGLLITLAAGYAVFMVRNEIASAYFQKEPWSHVFGKLEQLPGTSIYTSHAPGKQVRDLIHTLSAHGAVPVLLLCAVVPSLAFLLRRGRSALGPAQARALLLAAVCSLSYAFFFLINNSMNGFVYSVLLPAPMIMGVLASQTRLLRLGSALLAAVFLACAAFNSPDSGPKDDPLLKEARFLDALLRPGDMMLVPGNPFPELNYLRRFNFLVLGELGEARAAVVPRCRPAQARSRVAGALSRGRRVYFAPGDFQTPFPGGLDDDGAQKRRQIFWAKDAGSAQVIGKVAALRKELGDSFRLDCSVASAQGWRYCSLSPRAPVRRAAPAPASPQDFGGELGRLAAALEPRLQDDHDRPKLRYLLAWLAETPGDVFVQRDIVALITPGGREPSGWSEAARSFAKTGPAAPAPLVWWALPVVQAEAMQREKAAALVQKGIDWFGSGDNPAADTAFRKALELDPQSVDAWMSLGALSAADGRNAEALACYDKVLSFDFVQGERKAEAQAARAQARAALAPPSKPRR
jgi:tetratricopeptide (TPR) repeat protein